MRGASVAASGTADNIGGLVGLAAQAIDNLGEWGVGLFTLAETVLPPIPSEVVLPLAGFLAKQGDLNLVLIFVTSTLGAYLGALLLYWLGAKLGLERSIRGLSKDLQPFYACRKRNMERGAHRSGLCAGHPVPADRAVFAIPQLRRLRSPVPDGGMARGQGYPAQQVRSLGPSSGGGCLFRLPGLEDPGENYHEEACEGDDEQAEPK